MSRAGKPARTAARGIGLVESLVTLAVVGGLLSILSGVLYQTALTAERQDAIASTSEAETSVRHLLQARLDAVALVADSALSRDPYFEVNSRKLVFVTRFNAPAPITGLWEIEVEANPDELVITLTDWPENREQERVTLALPDVSFRSEGMGEITLGLPRAIVMSLPGGPARLRLGSELPLDCVLALPAKARENGELLCPGVRQ